MDVTPYWIATAKVPAFPKLAEDLQVDVVVVGGGITGITTAYMMKKAGLKVALLERDRFAAVDSGHTTAHLTYVTDMRLVESVKNLGRDHAQAFWDAGAAAITHIHENTEAEGIDAEFAWVPGYLHAPLSGASAKEKSSLQEEARLAHDLGFEAQYLDSVPCVRQPGVRFANQAKFHPRKYLAGLLATVPGDGSHVFQESELEAIEEEPLQVKANGHTIKCGFVVVATHVPLHGLTGRVSAELFQTKLAPYSTYVVGARVPSGVVPEASYWDTADPYNYLRIDRHEAHDYAIFGGGDHKTGQSGDTRDAYAAVEKNLLAMIPQAVIDRHWSGQVIESADGLPFIGEILPKQFVATGFAGNGMTFGTLSAMMAVDAAMGRANPWRDLFHPDRKIVRGGVWDYLRENKDYPFYFLKDRLSGTSTVSLEALKPGEGQVVKLPGGRCAAYRDHGGRLVLKSAVCTHLGCVVRWNPAETTWDCPCHGSRFKATGEVLGGPAESPLADMPAD